MHLCASFKEHQKNVDNEQPLTWIQPFGAEKEGFMFGTETFPVLVLENQNYIPKQEDGYNCGIATVATIGIILRDVLQKEETESKSLFNDMSAQSLLPIETQKIERKVLVTKSKLTMMCLVRCLLHCS